MHFWLLFWSTKIRIHNDAIRPFCGEGDVITWSQMVKVMARLKGIEVDFMALYLEGNALVLYLEMD